MDEDRFWSCALGEWVRDCVCGTSAEDPWPILAESSWRHPASSEGRLRYSELCDGVALNLVLCYIANCDSVGLLLLQPHPHVERSESLSSGVSSSSTAFRTSLPLPTRLRQFQNLLGTLSKFYRSKSLLILSLPDVLSIAKSPVPEISGHEMHKLLSLLLGAAVQSPQREHFIERIKRMRPDLQSELAQEIQRVTSNNDRHSAVLNLDSLLAELGTEPEGQGAEAQQRRIVAMLERALRERDELANGMLELAQEMEHDEGSPSNGSSSALTTAASSCNGDSIPPKAHLQNGGFNGDGRSPSPSAMDRHTNVELAAAKAELRKLRNENEEKEEMLLELQDELERQRAEIGRLQSERLELVKDARAAKDYRDEMDCMQHKLSRLERLEGDNEKLRAKLSELDFYKSRVGHLKEDNQLMQETCRVMEEQLEQCQRKLTAHLEVENKLIEAQANVKALQLDLTKTRERVEDLLVENGRLERELKVNVQKYAELEREMHHCLEGFASPRSSGSLNDSSLLAQMDAYNQSQILELQLENRKLKARLDSNTNVDPAELFEIRAELTEAERTAKEKADECARLAEELEAARKGAFSCAERATKMGERVEQMEAKLAEHKRHSVPTKTHQGVLEQLEREEQKRQELELNAQIEREQLALLKAEKSEVEAQLSRMCTQQRDTRGEMDALRERLEAEREQWQRERKALEADRNAAKGRVEEKAREELALAQRNAESANRRTTELDRMLAESGERAQRADMELAQMRQKMDEESRRAQHYREELAAEQNRLRDLLARLRSVCLMAVRNGNDESDKCCLEPSCLDDDLQLIAIIDDLLMGALTAARKEADALRIQQQKQIRELDDLKRDIQGLRKTGNELNLSSDSQLLTENKNIKEQVNLLQERLQSAQSEESTRAAELQAAKREIEELQQRSVAHSRQSAELANAQMALRAHQMQEEQLRGDLAKFRAQLEAGLKAHAETQKRLDSLELIHSALASDHDRLQNLHQMLSRDYDRVKREKETLRQKCKGEKMSTEHVLRAEFERDRAQLEQALEAERTERQREARRVAELEEQLDGTAKELTELKRERNFNLFRSEDSADELRRLRLSECAQKSSINSLNVIIQQLNNALTEKDLELGNLRRQVEMLRQYSGEENRTLIRQIELLLVQNQQLHNRSDAFYAEQKELQEKLLTLRRHKEKLEEKIMEQYKSMDSRKVERPTFMKRAARALIAKSPSRKSGRGKDLAVGNSASDKSEDSSIYSTDELSRNTTLGNSPPPPPPCPPGLREDASNAHNGAGGAFNANSSSGYEQLPLRNSASCCSGSLYSSISSSAFHHPNGCSIERGDHPPPTHYCTPNGALRPRNSRVGGSLRCPPSHPGMMARSFPCPTQWRRENGAAVGKLPACCKVIQEDPILPSEQREEERQMAPQSLPPAHIAQPQIIRELPPKAPVQQQQRPPPPPYPGQPTPKANGLPRTRTAASPAATRSAGHSPFAGRSVNAMPPRDSSTPKSAPSAQGSQFMGPSPIGFLRANSLASGKSTPATANENQQNGGVQTGEDAFRSSVRNADERAEKAASVYENVASEKGQGEKGRQQEGQRREGPKGEIWYEFGCV